MSSSVLIFGGGNELKSFLENSDVDVSGISTGVVISIESLPRPLGTSGK